MSWTADICDTASEFGFQTGDFVLVWLTVEVLTYAPSRNYNSVKIVVLIKIDFSATFPIQRLEKTAEVYKFVAQITTIPSSVLLSSGGIEAKRS